MKNGNPMKDYKQWLIVSNTEHKHDPVHASPLCIVETFNRDDEYALHLFMLKTELVGYDLKYHSKSFIGRLPPDCEFMSVKEFTNNYNDGNIMPHNNKKENIL